MHLTENGKSGIPAAIAFAQAERKNCLSDREWRFRLQGYGYDLRDTPNGRILTRFGGAEIGAI